MKTRTLLAITGNGLARAERRSDGDWTIEHLLPDFDFRCLASDPHDPLRLYAGTQGNGVRRSIDGGRTWAPWGMNGRIVKSIAVSPHDPQVLYAGTKPACLFISRDGGANWSELEGFRNIRGRWLWFSPAEKPGQAYVIAIALSPTDPDVLLAGVEFGATVRSDDGGITWSNHIQGSLRDCHNLKFHACDGNWTYEAGGTGGGASFSRDGGRTWRKSKSGLAKHYGVSCAADPERPEVWYVSVAPSPGKAYGEKAQAYLYRATGGAGWQPIGWESHPMKRMPTVLVTDPISPGHLYAGLTNGHVWHSTDYGDSWQRLSFDLGAIWSSMLLLREPDV